MLSKTRAVALKTALYHDAVKHGYVVSGFRVYKRNIFRKIVPVPGRGKPCRAMIRVFETRRGLPVTGQFCTATQNELIPPVLVTGRKIAEMALKLVDLAPRHYTQARPFAGTLADWERRGGDCSGTAILVYKLAGAPDPNGTNYDGSGYTGSLIEKGVKVEPGHEQAGDLTFYSTEPGGTSEHVVIELGELAPGFVFSHGHEGGPLVLKEHYRGYIICTRRYPTSKAAA